MADERDDTPKRAVPEWQRSSGDGGSDNPSGPQDRLDVARRFLDDDEVKTAPRDKKVAFLQAKGIADADITKLLGDADSSTSTSDNNQTQSDDSSPPTPSTESPANTPSESSSSSLSLSNHAPVVTYPEFLAKPQTASPPPLVTTAGLLTTLQITGALSALIAGSSRLVFTPMMEELTAAREDFHTAASSRLADLVELLEKTVSVVPPAAAAARRKGGEDSDSDDTDDPSEMFHRDVGTQTILPVPSMADAPKQPAYVTQATRISNLSRSLSDLEGGIRSQCDDLTDVKSLVDVLRDDLDALTYRSPASGTIDFTGGLYGSKTDAVPDEMRKVRDSIRRIKGVLLSAKSFPHR